MAFGGVQGKHPEPAPVTLPQFACLDKPAPDNLKEVARRFIELRTIRAGADAWQTITKAESFEAWKSIGKALQVGRDHALRVTMANAPMGQRYSKAFSAWIKRHHFDTMPKSTRSVAIELNENIAAITAWRATLSEKAQRRLVHPLSNVARWKKTTAVDKSSRIDVVEQATATLNKFLSLMESLPPDQAAPLWQSIQARAAIHLTAS
jgi:hypothetical protein